MLRVGECKLLLLDKKKLACRTVFFPVWRKKLNLLRSARKTPTEDSHSRLQVPTHWRDNDRGMNLSLQWDSSLGLASHFSFIFPFLRLGFIFFANKRSLL